MVGGSNNKEGKMKSQDAFKARKAMAVIDCAVKTAKAAWDAYNAMKDIPIIGAELGRIAAFAAIEAGKMQVMNIRATREHSDNSNVVAIWDNGELTVGANAR